jgi:uncharacterized membrane protein
MACIALIIAAAVVAIVLFPRLPATMTTHWNAAGQPDGFAPKAFGDLVAPPLMAFLFAAFRLIPAVSPRGACFIRKRPT